ncbi:MAG: hypothetical protein ACT4PP_05740 [Sporichthyaceae bacterium]
MNTSPTSAPSTHPAVLPWQLWLRAALLLSMAVLIGVEFSG